MTTPEQPPGYVCVQVQPARALKLDLRALRAECEALARSAPGVRGVEFTEGWDNGPFLNILFAAAKPQQAWRSLHVALLEISAFATQLRVSCIATCTGEDGWNDYLLLHHFDKAVPLDV